MLAGGATLNPIIQAAGQQNDIEPALREPFLETTETMVAEGAAGFGELTALHFSFNNTHPFEMVRPDHPLFLLLSDVAGRNGVPIDFHMEAVAEGMAVPDQLRDRSASNPLALLKTSPRSSACSTTTGRPRLFASTPDGTTRAPGVSSSCAGCSTITRTFFSGLR